MESKVINTIPEGKAEVYHFSQNDANRTIRLVLTEALTGTETLAVHYVKLNGTIGSFNVPSTTGNNLDIDGPSSVTDISGYVYCKLRIDGIGAKAFFIEIERGA